MGIVSELEPATSIFKGGFSNLTSYSYFLIPLIVIVAGFLGIWVYKTYKRKNTQWTHTLRVRRVLGLNGELSNPVIHRMRRFPLIKKAEIFELEKPLLGGYLIPELDEYSGLNEFSLILDKNNRIYTNKGEFFNPDKSSVYVSAKHSEIDVQRQNLKANFQNINKINKRVEWATIAKFAMISIAIVAVLILGIVGIQNWGEAQEQKAAQAQAEAHTMEQLALAMKTMEATVNVQQLQLTKMLEQMYGTSNLQGIIKEQTK